MNPMNEPTDNPKPRRHTSGPNHFTRRSFIQASAAAVFLLPLAGHAGPAKAAGGPERLATLAAYFQDFTEKHLLDDDGLVRGLISPLTLRPFTIAELSPKYDKYMQAICQNGTDPAGAVTYENSLMATGEFAMSQIVRHEKTGSTEALVLARKAVGAILAVSRQGENYMPGFLPKPFGGVARARYSHEMSTDQYTKPLAALDLWLPYAAPKERDEILRFYKNAADFFIARNFRFPWRQKVIVDPNIHLHALALYIPLITLADRYGDKKYQNQLRRFEEPMKLLVLALEHPEQLPEINRNSTDLNFNGISLLLDGFAVAVRNGSTDVRLPDLMRRCFDRAGQNIGADGFGRDLMQKVGENSSWAVRVVAGAPLLARDSGSEQRGQLALRVLNAYDHVDRMRVVEPGEPVDGINGLSVSSWLLAYWRLK
jgi:hypothetical protein